MKVTGLAAHQAFYRELAHQLELSGISLAQSGEISNSQLIIHRQQLERRVLSVDGQGKTVEYELEELLEYSVQEPIGTSVREHKVIRVRRILLNPTEQVLGRAREETLLRGDMAKQLSRLLIDQLSSLP